jgi:hypothetical protein
MRFGRWPHSPSAGDWMERFHPRKLSEAVRETRAEHVARCVCMRSWTRSVLVIVIRYRAIMRPLTCKSQLERAHGNVCKSTCACFVIPRNSASRSCENACLRAHVGLSSALHVVAFEQPSTAALLRLGMRAKQFYLRRTAPLSFARPRSKVASGKCPALRALSRTRQSENPNQG